ncbi:antibiotic biosynthesis monooxygenase [Glutamicibacter sp. MNS18]|uniref:antibiotic biosynthesis monooxygenase family protein n=1 Tax=Glutamicibacter sp. MNS18 TaxID=2989817 RepID=UPI003531998B
MTNRIDVTADAAEAFEKAFIDSMRSTLSGVPGLKRTTLMRPETEGLPYVSTMEFDSRGDFMAWPKSDSFKASHSDKQAPGMRPPMRSNSTPSSRKSTPEGDLPWVKRRFAGPGPASFLHGVHPPALRMIRELSDRYGSCTMPGQSSVRPDR